MFGSTKIFMFYFTARVQLQLKSKTMNVLLKRLSTACMHEQYVPIGTSGVIVSEPN